MPPDFDRFESFGYNGLTAKHNYTVTCISGAQGLLMLMGS